MRIEKEGAFADVTTNETGKALENPRNRTLLIVAIIVVALNLRAAITAAGPLVGIIRDEIGLSNWSAGLITSLPLVAFSIVSPWAPKLGARHGTMRAILYGLTLLILGIAMRSLRFAFTVFAGTTILGTGIAIMNVLLPAIIKEKFPGKIGIMTSVYSCTMVICAAVAAGLSVPLSENFGLGWQFTLLSWILLALFGTAIWLTATRHNEANATAPKNVPLTQSTSGKLWRSTLAWQVTLFMGLQSLVFYTLVTWLPEMLQDLGYPLSIGGWALSYMQLVSLPATFIAPILADRYANQQVLGLLAGSLIVVGVAGLLVGGPFPLLILWLTIAGSGIGSSVSLALAFMGMRARNTQQAGELSGMAQAVGYLLAAIGPLLAGFMYDLTGTWTGPWIGMVAVSMVVMFCGWGAGRDKYVLAE